MKYFPQSLRYLHELHQTKVVSAFRPIDLIHLPSVNATFSPPIPFLGVSVDGHEEHLSIQEIRSYEGSSILWSPTMTLHRRSGRVAHQTSRRSFSSLLFFLSPSPFPSIDLDLIVSRFISRPSVVGVPSFFPCVAICLPRLSSLGFFLLEDRIVPAGSTFVRAYRRLWGFNNTGKNLDPDRKRTDRSKVWLVNAREQREVLKTVLPSSDSLFDTCWLSPRFFVLGHWNRDRNMQSSWVSFIDDRIFWGLAL